MLRTLIFFLLLSLSVGDLWAQNRTLDSLEAALKLRIDNQQMDSAAVLLIHAIAGRYSNTNPSKSEKYLHQSVYYADLLKNSYLLGVSYDLLAKFYMSQEQNDKALAEFQKSLSALKKTSAFKEVANVYSNIGSVYQLKGGHKESIEYQTQSLQIRERIVDSTGISKSLHNLAVAYKNLGQYDKAIEYHQRALDIRQKHGSAAALANTIDGLGVVYQDIGKYTLAAEYYFKALKIRESVKDIRGLVSSYINLGLVHADNQIYDKSIEYYQQASKFAEQINLSIGKATAINNIADVYGQKLRRYDSALVYGLSALEIYIKIQDSSGMGFALSSIGAAYYEQGQLVQAKQAMLRCLSIRSELAEMSSRSGVEVLLQLGSLYAKQNSNDSAAMYLRRAEQLAKAMGMASKLETIYASLSEMYSNGRKFDSAFFYAQKYAQVKDSIHTENANRQIAELQTKYDVERKDKTITLLTKDNAISELLLKNRESDLLRERITSENRRQQMTLLQSEKEISELRSEQSQTALREQKLLATQQNQQFNLLSQEKMLNETTLRQQVLVRNGFIGGAVAIAAILGLLMNRYRIKKNTEEQLRLKNEQIALLEQERLLADERGRIAKDIHDEVGPGMMKIALLAQNVEENVQQLHRGKIAETAEDVISSMNGIIWMTNPKNDTLDNLAAYIQEKAGDWFDRIGANKGMVLDFVLPDNVPALALEGNVRRNLYLSVKEALNNALKHSEASRVEISLTMLGEKGFAWRVSDNGKGFEAADVSRFSNGLANMRSRLEEIGGELHLESLVGQGTSITFRMGNQMPNTDFSR